ncbi:STAS domain-containing protein [Kribbella sp. HUAS MG21]|uniref:Anti-sigma factor antagonist n=1 Tax=Kribbella sp. HUAS MG21 TaxID=3160966 RepID=A0AAU7T3W9_9ACTN
MLAPTHSRPDDDTDDNTLHQDNVVHLTGILDVRSVGDVRQTLNDLIDSSDGDVIVDLEEVDAVDATGLGLLVATHRRTQLLGRQLVLWHPMPSVVRILAVTRLHRVLNVERTPLPISA